ncbi:hypothetical protein BJX76DRAFT_367837 [Aspergillus varians]
MDPASYVASKRPPKLRSACNECHAAKVRCSGEKTGCQRCSNLRLKCAFSISRIGKVPGKRSKVNRVAATTVSTSSSAPISGSSSSISTRMMSPPFLTATHTFETSTAYNERSNIPISVTSYPFPPEYLAGTVPLVSEANYAHSPPGYPTLSNPEDSSSLSNLCWTTELDQLGGPGLLSPDWEIDADESIAAFASQATSTSTSTYPSSISEERHIAKPYAPPLEPFPSAQYTVYLHLLHSISHTIQFSHKCKSPGNESMTTLDSIIVASQRYLTTLLQITDSPAFTHTYNDEHLLFSVALDKMIYLFSLGYVDFRRRMEVYEGMGINLTGPMDRWIRFGAFEVDVAEQISLCRRVFVEEVKRARVCLGRLMGAMSGSGTLSAGKHEGLCEEMKRKLDGLMDDLESDQSIHGVRFVD